MPLDLADKPANNPTGPRKNAPTAPLPIALAALFLDSSSMIS